SKSHGTRRRPVARGTVTDRLVPDFSQMPDARDPGFNEALLSWMAGTYSSEWPQLKLASYSATQSAAYGTGLALDSGQSIASSNRPIGEASFLVDLNYQSAMLGPCMGATILVAFAIESFLKMSFVAALELINKRTDEDRKAGFSELASGQLTAFDESSF